MLKHWLHGSVRINSSELDTAILNRLRRFKLRNVTASGFSVPLAHKREVVRILGKRIHTIHENRNVFTLLNFFYTRAALAMTAISCVATFFVLEQFAFRMEIHGIEGEERAVIAAYLRQNGVKRFMHKNMTRLE